MNDSSPSLCVVLAVTSDTALLDLGGIPNVVRTLDFLGTLFPSHTIVVAVAPELAARVLSMLDVGAGNYELAICQPSDPTSLARALEPFIEESESILIHDACRPLVSNEQFEQVFAAFDADVDAVRPSVPFTETLKILGPNSVIVETLDRSSVLRISTPELIRVAAIDKDASNCGWFLPLKKGVRTLNTEGMPEGTRVNTPADRDLMELHRG